MNDEQLESLLRAAGQMDEPAARGAGDLSKQVRVRRARSERRRRRIAAVTVLAGGYLAGLATMWLWDRAASIPQRVAADHGGPAAGEETALSPPPADTTAAPNAEPQTADPERQASTFPRISPYESLRRLGDEYLHGKGDVATALVFYRRALDEASLRELAEPDETDTWLLRSLKRDRLALSHNNETGDAT